MNVAIDGEVVNTLKRSEPMAEIDEMLAIHCHMISVGIALDHYLEGGVSLKGEESGISLLVSPYSTDE